MIRKEYKLILEADAKAMGVDIKSFKKKVILHFSNPRWQFIKKMRLTEYYKSKSNNPFFRFLYLVNYYYFKKYSFKMVYSIPLNVCGSGFSLPHYGTIVISKKAKIGKNVRIHACVNIGETEGEAPIIGDNIFISPGVKIFRPIKLGNNIKIGANAVVNKSFEEDNIVIAGVPAKIVKRLNELKK